jgi:cytidylate kinase
MEPFENEASMKFSGIIAIDGPAASGKTTLGKLLADEFGYLFLDTGVMYRAATLAAMNEAIEITDENAVSDLAQKIVIDILPSSVSDGRSCDIYLDGKDVTWQIRSPEVEARVSVVSAYSGVRKAMSERQRHIGLRGNVVMVGRDIGTVVLPEADVKIYLDASAEERAQRRYAELCARGENANYQEILDSMRRRDEIDSNRAIAPLKPAKDAIILNSNQMSVQQVYERVREIIQLEGNG